MVNSWWTSRTYNPHHMLSFAGFWSLLKSYSHPTSNTCCQEKMLSDEALLKATWKKSRTIEKLEKKWGGGTKKRCEEEMQKKKHMQRRKGMILLWCFSLSHTKADLLTSRGSENLLVCACICKYLETSMVTKPGQPPPEWTTFPGIPKDSRNKVSNLVVG